MIKKLLVFCFVILITNIIYSQENTSSPYSFYSLGENRFKGTNDVSSMGGITVYGDSLNLNILNPATFGNQNLTRLQVGGSSTYYRLAAKEQEEKAQKSSFDFLLIGMPVSKKIGVVFGVLPSSAVGYRFVNDNIETTGQARKYNGSGGVNKVFFGSGLKLNKNFSFGLDLQYYFGTIDTKTTLVLDNVQNSSREINSSTLSGFGVNFGFNYNRSIAKGYTLYSSLVFNPETKINSRNLRAINTIYFSASGDEITSGEIKVEVPDSKLINPLKTTFGLGIGNKQWFVGMDYSYRATSNLKNRFENNFLVSFENSSKIAFGGYIIPKQDSYTNYFNRVVYRAGVRYENTGLVLNNQSIKDQAVTFGFGLPIKGSFSMLNIGGEWGYKGTTKNGLVNEHYFIVNVGLLINDKWFRKNFYN